MTYSPNTDPDDDLFRVTVKRWVQCYDGARKDLARVFAVSQSTVDRWWLGVARPHPRLKRQIIAWIKEHTL